MKLRITTISTILLAFCLSFAALAQAPSGKTRPDGATPGQRPDGVGRQRPDGQRPDGAQPGQRPGGGRPGGGRPRG